MLQDIRSNSTQACNDVVEFAKRKLAQLHGRSAREADRCEVLEKRVVELTEQLATQSQSLVSSTSARETLQTQLMTIKDESAALRASTQRELEELRTELQNAQSHNSKLERELKAKRSELHDANEQATRASQETQQQVRDLTDKVRLQEETITAQRERYTSSLNLLVLFCPSISC